MASISAGKSLVEKDCMQHNPLVDLSKRVIEGSVDNDFEKTWNQFLTNNSKSENLHDEYLKNLTMSTAAPKTTNLYELADQMDPIQNLAEVWAEEYIAGQQESKNLVEQWADEAEQQVNYLPEQWAKEFSSLNFHEQEAENKSGTKDKSEMWATEFLDEFDRKSQMNKEFASENIVSAAETETDATTFTERTSFDESEMYIFDKNNPYLRQANAFGKGQQALNDGLIADAILYFEAAVQQNQEDFESWFQLGECQTENENDRQAIAAYRTALNLQPEKKEIQLALAIVYINECMELDALKVLKQWIMSFLNDDSIPLEFKTAPNNPVEDLTIQTQQVEDLIQKALSNVETANEATFHNALSLVYNIKGDYNQAAEEVKLALLYNPKNYVLWNRLGATLANGKRAAEAVAAYREALEICPNYTRARCNLGIACIHLQNYKEAIEHFITALQLQQSYSSISSSTIWTPLRAAVIRSYLPCALDLLAAVNEKNLENIISCNPLMPDQSVIPIFDNCKNKPVYSTSTSLYGKNIDTVEEWDSITPPPYKVIGIVIRAPNAIHEVEEKIISTIKESSTVYGSGSNGKDQLYVHGIAKESEESNSMFNSKHDEMNRNFEDMTLNYKTPTENSITKHNSSAHFFPNTNSTVTLEFTTSTSSTMNDTFKKIQNKLNFGKFVSDLQIIDIVEIFNILITLISPNLSSEVTSTTHYSSVLDNSTFRSAKDEFFDEVDTQTVTYFTEKALDKTFSQMHRNGESEMSRIKGMEELINGKHSGNSLDTDDYAVVKSEQDHAKFEKNSKLSPQVISRSEFAKNGINEQESGLINNCDHSGASKEDSGQRKISNCKTVVETKHWEPRDEMHEKYNEEHEKDSKSPVLVHFEKTFWEKLVAGLKCSQRDCKEALRPTESVRRYLIEPSISRARKHSNGQS
uniref:TPR_REGION domain-containing protein n=1 Tax=Onchocerca volvulus TaxID=6282 RepID=A0A8R1Y481_ONCVO